MSASASGSFAGKANEPFKQIGKDDFGAGPADLPKKAAHGFSGKTFPPHPWGDDVV